MSLRLFRRANVFKKSLIPSAVLLAASLALVSAAPPAWSQVGGVVDRTLSNQNELLRRVKPVPKQGQIDITVIDERELVPLEQAEKITFVLRSLSISGAETVTEQELQAAWRDKLGTTVSLADLYRIADEIEAIIGARVTFHRLLYPSRIFIPAKLR